MFGCIIYILSFTFVILLKNNAVTNIPTVSILNSFFINSGIYIYAETFLASTYCTGIGFPQL